MANEIFKELKTRIALKYNTYEYWTEGEGKDYAPLKGEVCFCAIPANNNEATTAPTVLFKVGVDGQTKFSALKWASALAADVYDWAKNQGTNVFTKDGNGNVISGIVYDASLNNGKGGFKYTTASVATSEGLKDLQDEVAALKKDVDDNRDAWVLDTDTRYTFEIIEEDGEHVGELAVKAITYTNGKAGEPSITYYDFVTPTELTTILQNYYGYNEIDEMFETLETKLSNGTFIVGQASNASNADYATEATKTSNALTVKVGGSDVVFDGSEAKTADVDSAIAAAEQRAKEYADAKPHENTAHTHAVGDGLLLGTVKGGIEGEVFTSLNLAFVEDKTNKLLKLVDAGDNSKVVASFDTTNFIADGMLQKVEVDAAANKIIFTWNTNNAEGKTVTEIELDKIADIYTAKANAAEVQVAISNTNEISATLTKAVTDDIAKGIEAHSWGNHANAGYALANDLGDLAGKDTVTEGDISGTISKDKITNFATEVANVKVANATNADKATDADKLGGQLPSHYATAESVTNITKDNGTIDSKIAAYNTSKKFGDIITHNVAEFATSAQGEKADSALQEITTTANHGLKVTNKNNIDIDTDVVFVLDCNW